MNDDFQSTLHGDNSRYIDLYSKFYLSKFLFDISKVFNKSKFFVWFSSTSCQMCQKDATFMIRTGFYFGIIFENA